MRQEHLAVGAFALLAQELAQQGCEPVVLSLVTRAASDEVLHTEICRRFAAALLGPSAVPARFRGLPRVPMHPQVGPLDRVTFHVVEMCCLGETLTGVVLTEMLARTREPIARCAIESLLEDEIDHGRVGWAYLATRAGGRRLSQLASALPGMFVRTLRGVVAAPSSHDEPGWESYGYLGERARAEACLRATRDVILPGFVRLGVDVAAARELLRARQWSV
jgi:hypothetical protein